MPGRVVGSNPEPSSATEKSNRPPLIVPRDLERSRVAVAYGVYDEFADNAEDVVKRVVWYFGLRLNAVKPDFWNVCIFW